MPKTNPAGQARNQPRLFDAPGLPIVDRGSDLRWAQSTDDFDLQANIRYDVYVNGVVQDVLFGSGGQSIVYGEQGANTVEVVTSDTAGNSSAPASIDVFF